MTLSSWTQIYPIQAAKCIWSTRIMLATELSFAVGHNIPPRSTMRRTLGPIVWTTQPVPVLPSECAWAVIVKREWLDRQCSVRTAVVVRNSGTPRTQTIVLQIFSWRRCSFSRWTQWSSSQRRIRPSSRSKNNMAPIPYHVNMSQFFAAFTALLMADNLAAARDVRFYNNSGLDIVYGEENILNMTTGAAEFVESWMFALMGKIQFTNPAFNYVVSWPTRLQMNSLEPNLLPIRSMAPSKLMQYILALSLSQSLQALLLYSSCAASRCSRNIIDWILEVFRCPKSHLPRNWTWAF